jgi:hypothetical protein
MGNFFVTHVGCSTWPRLSAQRDSIVPLRPELMREKLSQLPPSTQVSVQLFFTQGDSRLAPFVAALRPLSIHDAQFIHDVWSPISKIIFFAAIGLQVV